MDDDVDEEEEDDNDGAWPKCSGDPCEAEVGPGTGRRPVISQVTLVSFPSNTSTLPFPHPHP